GSTWTSIWSESGNQGNSWLSANIDLAAYVGGSVQLRLNTVSGTTWQGDIAIDDVSLTTTPPSTDICAGVAAWSSTATYQVGDLVTYQGFLYERTATGWTNLGACGTTNVNGYTLTSDLPEGPFSIAVYPNPVEGNYLNVASTRSDLSYTITNTIGQQLDQGKVIDSKVYVDQLKAGVYLIHLTSGQDNTLIRFIKE
ncbi:MAG: T9SS type A sorting domain-containing protein, partial [Bacteroidota bacterium]